MQVHFWGTRGSLPASITSQGIEAKFFRAVKASRKHLLSDDEAIHAFIQGFPFFTPADMPGHDIRIYSCYAGLEDAFCGQQNPVNFPVPLKAMGGYISFHTLDPGKTYHIAGFDVTGIEQNHPGDSFGYSFCEDSKKIVYSTDAEHKEDAEAENYAFIEFFRVADLLIFDARYSLLDAVDMKANGGHSSNPIGDELAV